MTAFDIDIKGRKRDELSRTEWLKLTDQINKLQPAIFSFKAGVISHRIDRPSEWDGEGTVYVKPYMRPYAIELERTHNGACIVRLHKLKWNGTVWKLAETAALTVGDAIELAKHFIAVVNQNWQEVGLRIAQEAGAVDFMVDGSLTYMRFRFLTPDKESMNKLNSIKVRKLAERFFLPCMVKFTSNKWHDELNLETVKLVLR